MTVNEIKLNFGMITVKKSNRCQTLRKAKVIPNSSKSYLVWWLVSIVKTSSTTDGFAINLEQFHIAFPIPAYYLIELHAANYSSTPKQMNVRVGQWHDRLNPRQPPIQGCLISVL